LTMSSQLRIRRKDPIPSLIKAMVYDSAACLGESFCSTGITSPSPKHIHLHLKGTKWLDWKERDEVSKSLFYLSFFNKSNSLSCGSSSNIINGIGSNSTLSLSGLSWLRFKAKCSHFSIIRYHKSKWKRFNKTWWNESLQARKKKVKKSRSRWSC